MDKRADTGADDAVDGKWLSYGELAALRGIDRTSALKLALRHKWTRQKNNHGQVRVLVPPDWLATKDKTTPPGADMSMALGALSAAVTSLTARAEAAERRADQAEARASAAEAAAAQAIRVAQEAEAARKEPGVVERLKAVWKAYRR